MLSELTEDNSRNRLIVGDIIKEASNGGGVCLVLSDRKEHCHALQDMLSKQGMNADVLTGSVCNGERKTIVERLHAGKCQGLDCHWTIDRRRIRLQGTINAAHGLPRQIQWATDSVPWPSPAIGAGEGQGDEFMTTADVRCPCPGGIGESPAAGISKHRRR